MSDLISRCELFNRLAPVKTLGEAYGIIQGMPTVDAVPVWRGKWERHFYRPNVYADLYWHCSACGGKQADSWADKYKFCPDCGARMDGRENGNETG